MKQDAEWHKVHFEVRVKVKECASKSPLHSQRERERERNFRMIFYSFIPTSYPLMGCLWTVESRCRKELSIDWTPKSWFTLSVCWGCRRSYSQHFPPCTVINAWIMIAKDKNRILVYVQDKQFIVSLRHSLPVLSCQRKPFSTVAGCQVFSFL